MYPLPQGLHALQVLPPEPVGHAQDDPGRNFRHDLRAQLRLATGVGGPGVGADPLGDDVAGQVSRRAAEVGREPVRRDADREQLAQRPPQPRVIGPARPRDGVAWSIMTRSDSSTIASPCPRCTHALSSRDLPRVQYGRAHHLHVERPLPEDPPRDAIAVAEGSYDGLTWSLWAYRGGAGRRPGREDYLGSRITLTGGDGRHLHGGGGRGPAPTAAQPLHVTTGGADTGPYHVMATFHLAVARVEVIFSDGRAVPMAIHDAPDFPEARFAVLLVPRDSLLDCVLARDAVGAEQARFSLAFHQDVWHDRITRR